MKVEGLNHIFHIYIPYIPLMIEQKSLFSQKVGGGGGISPPPSPPGSAGPVLMYKYMSVGIH